MDVETNAIFLDALKRDLSTKLSENSVLKVISAVSRLLEDYDISQKKIEDCTDDNCLEAYIFALCVEGLSTKTIRRYRYIIERLMKYIDINTKEITVNHLRQYLADEKKRGISDGTLEGVRQVINAYFNWLYREHMIDTNPVANLGAIKCAKKIKTIYSSVDLEKMKFCCKSVRDRAIISFLASTGCRISELTQLNRDDIDFTNLECAVSGKGNKDRTIYFDQVTGMLLREYLDERKDNSAALFVGKGTERLKDGGVRFMLKKLQDEAKIETKVHPHKFRRTLATNLIRHGMPIQEVAAILGHDKLDTTMKYVVLDKTEVKNSYKKYA